MIDRKRNELLELTCERARLLRCEVETEDFNRNEPIAAGLVRAKNGPQPARTNLMENPEGSERVWREVQDRIFAVQRPNGNITPVPSERGSYPSESARTPVDIRRFPWVRKLAADYAFQFSSLSPFFSGDPALPASWAPAIANAQKYVRPRGDLSRILAAQLARRNAPAAAREAAALLADPQAVAIVTGQQAGLFGGPIFTLFKALTAVKLARQVAHEHHVPTVAVFWVEAEDHDWDEVSSCSVLDAEFQRRTITLPPPAGAGQAPIGLLKIGDDIAATIDELGSALPPSEFTSWLLDGLRTTYAPGVGMADAFARWIERLVGDLGLIVFDCSDRAAKPLASQVFAHEVRHAGRTWELAGLAGQQLAASGYHAQVTGSLQDGAALFRLNGTRAAIDAGEAAGLETDARTRPETFSPNVLLRPIVEDALFPTVCYVSGPNELAYLAQLGKVYEHFGVPMPLFFPRTSATVLDSASARFLAKHDLPFEALQARDESALNRLLAASLPESVDRALREADEAIERSMMAIMTAVPAIDQTLEGAARSTLGKLQHDLSTLRGKVIGAAKKRDETLRRQFFRAQAQAFPDGIPQERALGSISLLNRYGPALVQSLVKDLPLDIGHHWILTL
jgi:bacillithiol biosynthesis cysteine-adding enzyme BshC